MTIKEMLRELEQRLTPAVGAGEARAMALIIIEDIKGYRAIDIAVNGHRELLPETEARMLSVAARVVAGEPVQYALGSARFAGRDFRVTPDVLIPRPETAQLVDIVADDADGRPDLRVLDIGTGSGCIAVTLALTLRFPRVDALDISDDALAVAADNAKRHRACVAFRHDDILTAEAPRERYDIIVSNPPYVLDSERPAMDRRVVDHEPPSALFVPDSDPLRFYKAIAAYARRALAPAGRLYLEINPLCVAGMRQMLAAAGFENIDVIRDFRGAERFIKAW